MYCDAQDPLDVAKLLDLKVSLEVVDGVFNELQFEL